jgi:hypothetical protein
VNDVVIPIDVSSTLTRAIAHELAETYGDQVVFPDQVVVDRPEDPDRHFPGWPGMVLVIAVENQGVCAWGVPLGNSDPSVLVGGELSDGEDYSDATMAYTASVGEYVAVRRWDRVCLNGGLLLQAQAAELDQASMDFLRANFREVHPTQGWPAAAQFRFEGSGGVKIMLWSDKGQCDWWLSAAIAADLDPVVRLLLDLSDLRTSMWSNDLEGEVLLRAIRDR